MESTYGDKPHNDPEQAYLEMRAIILRTLKRSGKVIIPSFAVGRTQEVVYDLQHLVNDNRIGLDLALQAQAQALRALPTLDAQEARRALEQSVKALGPAALMTPQMDRLSVSLKGVSAQALAQWLASARQNAHLVPSEAHLRRSAAGVWDGTVVFTLPAQ